MNNKVKYAGSLLFVVLGATVALTQAFQPDLDFRGHLTVMMLLITIGLWIFRPFDISFSITSCFFLASLLIIGVPAADVFSGFSQNAVWTLIPALFFGFALAKTGLGKRIAYFCMKSIKVTIPTMLLMWAVIGVTLSLLTPSITVRVVIIIPIALQCIEVCKLAEGSKARSLILITAWAMAVIPGTGWLTGSLAGPILSGFYDSTQGLEAVDFASWLKVSLLPVALISIFTVIVGYFLLKPEEKISLGKEVFKEEYAKLGKMSFHEKVTGIVLSACFIMFTTNSIHHVPDAATCLVGLFILGLTRCILAKEVSTGISWDLVVFIGTAMGFGAVFTVTGVSAWMSNLLVSAIAPITTSPWLFVMVILLLMFIWRFVDIATFIPTMAIVSSIAPAVATQFGIDPLVWIPLLCIAMNSFFFSYTNMFALVGEANTGAKGWTAGHLTRYGTGYFVVSMLVMCAAIPYWMSLGLFG